MPIGREEVERAARLARLALDEETITRLVGELSRVIDYVSLLEDVVGDAEENVLAPPDITRPDVPGETLTSSEALENAPRTGGGFFEVPGFLPDDEEETA